MYQRWGEGYTFEDIEDILNYNFKSEEEADSYLRSLTTDMDNFATNIVYYSLVYGVYDMEDNNLGTYGYDITDIPNVTPEVVKIIDDYILKDHTINSFGS
jgi:hypothetical protein